MTKRGLDSVSYEGLKNIVHGTHWTKSEIRKYVGQTGTAWILNLCPKKKGKKKHKRFTSVITQKHVKRIFLITPFNSYN